ncbi:MAG: Crp/Fnr family transcriptional regulator [Bacilli bacterium]|nr:Crp/Fnr family transcriptional regulator [Bacilli bacterium]
MADIFSNISLKNKDKLIRNLRGHNVNYNKNEIIVDHLNDEDDIGLVLSGTVQIVKNNYNGSTSIIDTYEKNDLILSNHIYLNNNETNLVAKEDSEILIFSYNTIISQEVNDKLSNQFIKNLFITMNEEVTAKNERIQILTKRSIRDKLLEYFNLLSKKSASRIIYLPFNFSDLANYLAIDRSAMSRELGYLKEEGFIQVKGKKITLLYR